MMSDRHFQWNGIRLRAPEPEDLEVMFRFENATDVWEMSNTTGPYSRFQLKQYIEQTQNDLFDRPPVTPDDRKREPAGGGDGGCMFI